LDGFLVHVAFEKIGVRVNQGFAYSTREFCSFYTATGEVHSYCKDVSGNNLVLLPSQMAIVCGINPKHSQSASQFASQIRSSKNDSL
jgi:hypothetical protein